jgi:hypothetical protein
MRALSAAKWFSSRRLQSSQAGDLQSQGHGVKQLEIRELWKTYCSIMASKGIDVRQAKLPNASIVVVHRADGSGTTYSACTPGIDL